MFYQHGDVLLHQSQIHSNVSPIDTNVLQEGEHTGHAHRIHSDPTDYQVFEDPKTKEKFLRVVRPVSLKHEEHHERIIPPGEYKVGIVREYDHFIEEARQVAD